MIFVVFLRTLIFDNTCERLFLTTPLFWHISFPRFFKHNKETIRCLFFFCKNVFVCQGEMKTDLGSRGWLNNFKRNKLLSLARCHCKISISNLQMNFLKLPKKWFTNRNFAAMVRTCVYNRMTAKTLLFCA